MYIYIYEFPRVEYYLRNINVCCMHSIADLFRLMHSVTSLLSYMLLNITWTAST